MNSTLKNNLVDYPQRSDEWFEARAERFTASKATEVESTGRRDMTEEELKAYKEAEPKGRRKTIDCIGDGAINEAVRCATEAIIGIDKEDHLANIPAIKRGRELEPIAFKQYKELKALEFLDVVEVGFCIYGEHAGCSLDGYVSDNSGLEIKCPGREKFFRMVAIGASELDPKWIAQVQFQMMCTDTDRTRFVIFYAEEGESYMHEFIIERDEERISAMKERLDLLSDLKEIYKQELLIKLNK